MKKIIISALLVAGTVVLTSAVAGDGAITRQGDKVVINTKTIVKGVVGYNGSTHVKIHIRNNKIEKVEALPNQEEPQYFARAKKVLEKFKGKTVDKAATMKVDAVSGATFSSESLVKTVQQGLKHYQTKK